VPGTSTRCAQKLPWETKELNGLKNKTTKAAKKMKESEQRCMKDSSRAILLLLEGRIKSVMGYCL
jgi:hypothetical protein